MKIQIADTIYSITEACPSEIPNFDYLRSQLIEHGKALQATLGQLVLLEDSDSTRSRLLMPALSSSKPVKTRRTGVML